MRELMYSSRCVRDAHSLQGTFRQLVIGPKLFSRSTRVTEHGHLNAFHFCPNSLRADPPWSMSPLVAPGEEQTYDPTLGGGISLNQQLRQHAQSQQAVGYPGNVGPPCILSGYARRHVSLLPMRFRGQLVQLQG